MLILTSGRICGDSPLFAIHLQLTLKRMDQTAALTKLLPENSQLMLEPEVFHTMHEIMLFITYDFFKICVSFKIVPLKCLKSVRLQVFQ